MFLLLYSILFPIAFLLYLPFYLVHIFRRGGLSIDFWERIAIYTKAKRQRLAQLDKPIWIHAVSVGETVAALTFIRRWRERSPNQPFVFSASTSTGFATACKKLPKDIVPIYCPIDCFFAVTRAIHAIRPAMLCIFEVEIWPNLIAAAKRNGAKVVLVNGRMSDHSSQGYARWKAIFAPIFRSFDAICVQTDEDKRRIERVIGHDPRLHVCDTMKFDQIPDVAANDFSPQLAKAFGPSHKLIFTAGSTHPGEEDLMCDAFTAARAKHPELAMVLVPRHCERAADVAATVRRHGLSCRFSFHDSPDAERADTPAPVDVLIVNTTGELMNVFAASDIAFVGKSTAGQTGGHNIIEPAIFAKPVVYGPHLENFRQVDDIFQNAHAAIRLDHDDQLAQCLTTLADDPARRAELGQKARAVVEQRRGAIDRTLDVIDHVLHP
ncbi:MAG: 3-deoxy-D-manno-octulosonic acid transferase [Oligosphaeraceae bacterium]